MKVFRTFGSGKVLLSQLLVVLVLIICYKFSNKTPITLKPDAISNTDRFSSLIQNGSPRKPDGRDDRNDPTNIYCNSPFTATKGSEGDSPDGFKLRMIHIFIRHGQRTPFDPIPGYHPDVFDCNFRKWYPEHGHNEKFKRFPDGMNNSNELIVKFLERFSYASYPYKDDCGVLTLTSLGTLQLLNLGQYFYDSYTNNKHLFDRKSSLTSQIHIRSTNCEHTIQSTLAFLYGFLPAFNLSELILTKSDNEFMCVSDCVCNITKDLLHWRDKFVNRQKSYRDHKRLEAQMQKVVSANNDKVLYLKSILDYLLCSYCHGTNAPCSNTFPYVCLQYTNLEKLWKGYIQLEISASRDPDKNDLKYSYLILYPVLTEISNRIEDYIKGESTRKVIVYFGHGRTTRALLSVFGLYDGKWPPVASRFVIELYEATSGEGKERFYFRIIYNGLDVTDWLSICQENGLQSMCEFEKFKYFVSSTLYEHFKTRDYKAVCGFEMEMTE